MSKLIGINRKAKLYSIKADGGYHCLGFQACKQESVKYATWLGDANVTPPRAGTKAAYEHYEQLLAAVSLSCVRSGRCCDVNLVPQLVSLEGKRVKVVDKYGTVQRFWVGKSTGHIPIHLAIARKSSSGGGGVHGAPFKSVEVIDG